MFSKKRKVIFHRIRYKIIEYYPPEIMEVKTHLKLTKVKLAVTFRCKQPKHRKNVIRYTITSETFIHSKSALHQNNGNGIYQSFSYSPNHNYRRTHDKFLTGLIYFKVLSHKKTLSVMSPTNTPPTSHPQPKTPATGI